MTAEMSILITAAISISFLHTVTGPDHYLPFIALSKARGWTLSRTMMWTLICGCGHVWSSVLLGLGGAAIGWSFSKISWFENIRGGVAGWALMLFGIGYSTWAFIQLKQGKRHKHFDIHGDGSIYVYEHKPGANRPPKRAAQSHAVGHVHHLRSRTLRAHDSAALFPRRNRFFVGHFHPYQRLHSVHISCHGLHGLARILGFQHF